MSVLAAETNNAALVGVLLLLGGWGIGLGLVLRSAGRRRRAELEEHASPSPGTPPQDA